MLEHEKAFEKLVSEHQGRLFSAASQFFRDADDARDALQDALLAAYASLETFRADAGLYTWTYRIVVNACLMSLRRRRRRPEFCLSDLHNLGKDSRLYAWTCWGDSPERVLERRRLQYTVRHHLARLPERYRTVLLLRDIDEVDTRTTAGLLGISENTVKVRLHRARRALSRLMANRASERANLESSPQTRG